MPPPRPSTAQGGRGPPQRFPQQGGYQGSYDDSFAPAPRPSSFDDVYDNYQQQGGSGDFPAREPYAAPTQSDMPNFDGVPAHRPRGSFDQHMNSGEQGLPQRGPSRVPELNRTKSQPDLRQPQQVVFEMAGDIPPLPPMGNQYQAGTPDQPSGPAGGYSQQGPGPGLPNGPGPARRGSEASSQSPSNPDSLPSHPTPIRPGLMPNSVASQMVNKPAPVRNYGGPVPPTGTMSSTPVPIQPAVPAAGALDPPVTPELLERLRNTIKSDPNDQASALILAKKLVQAMELLVPNLPDPRTRAKARDRYSMDAHKILKKLAGAQNPDAMFFMADCLGKGIFGPEPDNKEAFTLYQSAAKLGNAAAAYRTAVCCEIGNEDGGGTRRDPLKAIQWYKRACLSPETMVRTTTGNKATRDIQVGDMLLDDEDRPVQCLTAGPIQTSSNMKTVKYQEYDSSKNVSFKCTSDHIMTLRATNVKPFVAANSRVFWHTRCDRSEVREDAEDIKWDQVMHELFTELSDELGRRPTEGEARRYIHAVTDPRIVPDSQDEDPQMHDDPVHSVSPAMFEVMHRLEKLGVDVDDMGPGIGLRVLEHMNEYLENFVPEGMAIPDDDDDLDIYVDAPRPRPFATLSRMPSSSMYPSDASFHPASEVSKEDLMEKFAIVREKLNSPKTSAKCKNQACKGIRVASARFKTDEQARFAANLLSGDHYRVIDPYVVKEFDLFTMTLEEYQATCHYQQNPVLRKMRLYRSPLSYLPANAPSSSVPIDPYWLGFWLGAGNNHKPLVSSSDMEIKVYCQTYVDRLNREGAAGTVGLHLAEEVASKAGDSTTFPDGRTCTNNVATYNWSLSLNSRGAGAKNPITQGLRDLGLYQDKSGGIPDCYRNADEDTRLAVLAGLIESHGSLSQRTNVYCFSQTTYEHKKMVEDAQKLATSCGIQCTQVSESQTAREPTWRFWMSKGSEKFQHHLLTPRKRLDASKVVNRRQNRDMRSFDVEDAGEGQYRLIEVSGGLYQLADRTVVHNCTLGDTPAMYKVGMILLKGLLGQPRNPREAVGWLKRAAERADPENPHALHELGLLYENARPEDVILRDEVYAFSLFKQAADLGYKFSQFRMGCAYEYGLMGCPIDPRLSIMWYSKAATQEEHQSELALSGWYLTGSEGVLQQSDTEAYLWARKAAMAGLAKAEYAMGYFTEVGIGVPASMEDAKRWYWRAAGTIPPPPPPPPEDNERMLTKRQPKTSPRLANASKT